MELLLFVFVTWPIAGSIVGLFYVTWRVFRLFKVKGGKNFPWRPSKVIVVCNHPSMWLQPLLSVGMFVWAYMFRPFRYGPYTLADKRNFGGPWWGPLVKHNLILVDRDRSVDHDSIRRMNEIASRGNPIISFAEGGRTWTGKKSGYVYVSPEGNVMRPFKSGFAHTVSKYGYTIVPAWDEVCGIRMTRIVGEPITNLGGKDPKEIIHITMQAIFELADREYPADKKSA